MATWHNWAGNQSSGQILVEHARSPDEVATVVKDAVERGARVKVTGAGLSWSGIGRPEQVQLILANMASPPTVRAGLVTAWAGLPMRHLHDFLAGAGKALPNPARCEAATVGGVLSTGSHGSAGSLQSMASQIVGLQMVLADGTVTNTSPEVWPELWAAARVGLGALGVITSVTMRCVPLFGVRSESRTVRLEELLSSFHETVSGHDHFSASWLPHTKSAVVRLCTRLPLAEGLDRTSGWRDRFHPELVAGQVHARLARRAARGANRGGAARRREILIPGVQRAAALAYSRATLTDLSYKVLGSRAPTPAGCEAEYAVRLEWVVPAVRAIVRAVNGMDSRIPLPIEIQVGAADDIPLSNAYGRDTAYLSFSVPAGADHGRYFDLVAEVLGPFDARPHWGKLHGMESEALRARYPLFDEFVAIRNRLDPTGLFSNDYLDRVLGPAPARLVHPARP